MDDFSQYYSHNPENKYSPDFFQKKDTQKKEIRKMSLWTGFAVLFYVIIQNGLFILMSAMGFGDHYLSDPYFSAGADIFFTVFGIFLPFSLAGKKLQKISGAANPIPLEAPKKKSLFLFGTVACAGCIMLANIISSYAVYIVSLFGYELSSPEIPVIEGPLGLILNIIRIALLTAVVEEYCLRGVVMGNFRKYGDLYAIIISSLVFALMHGNLVQAPFALLSGVALGYFTVKTGTVWTGVLAHAINNGLSVVITYIANFIGQEASGTVYLYSMYVIIFVGMFSFFIFATNTKNDPLKKSDCHLSFGERIGSFIFTPTMMVSLLLMLYITANTVSK